MGRGVMIGLCMLGGLGCSPDTVGPQLPELLYEGEHVRVGTDFGGPICAGTIADFDREIERMEDKLELDAEGKTNLWILADHSRYEFYCPASTSTCAPGELVDGTLLRRHAPVAMWHALAHDRINRAARPLASSHPLFVEGLSEALARAYCEPALPSLVLPDAATLLAGSEHAEFEFYEVFLASQLTRWLLETQGPQALQDFMVEIDHGDDPETVRAAYLAAFGTTLDDDLFAHVDWSTQARHPYEVGCRGAPPPVDISGSVYSLQANLDCDSELVRSNFYEHRPEQLHRGWVEWTLEVETAGQHELVGELPDGTEMTIARCDCQAVDSSYWPGADPTLARAFSAEYLQPGLYRVVWKGPLDAEQSLDVQIIRH
jgi:hypothetical protein